MEVFGVIEYEHPKTRSTFLLHYFLKLLFKYCKPNNFPLKM